MTPNEKAERLVKQSIAEGKISEAVGKTYLHKYNINAKVLDIYGKVQKKEKAPLTQQELQDINVDLIRWDIRKPDQQPQFFRQVTSDVFKSYKVPKFALHDLLDIEEYCYAASLKIGYCMSLSEHVKTGKTLLYGAGWAPEE